MNLKFWILCILFSILALVVRELLGIDSWTKEHFILFSGLLLSLVLGLKIADNNDK